MRQEESVVPLRAETARSLQQLVMRNANNLFKGTAGHMQTASPVSHVASFILLLSKSCR